MPEDFTQLTNLAALRVGAETLLCSDDFFAAKENLIKPEKPIFLEHEYTDRGKWMDGWESRRKRADPPGTGHDWCIIKLGLPGIIRGIDVDTSFFKGNFPSHCSLDVLNLDTDRTADQLPALPWRELLPKSPLKGDSPNLFPITTTERATHIRFNIHPDGGVARLRVHGDVLPDWPRLIARQDPIDLAAVENAGLALCCSDMFFGIRHNLLMPGRAANMGDGWETKRRRNIGPGNDHDWVIIRLGRRGILHRIELDTNHFKGNFPDTADIEGFDAGAGPQPTGDQLAQQPSGWTPVLARTKLQASTRHYFEIPPASRKPLTHVRLNIYPDGGVSRLRLWGEVTQ